LSLPEAVGNHSIEKSNSIDIIASWMDTRFQSLMNHFLENKEKTLPPF
jgi:hypothetical protein